MAGSEQSEVSSESTVPDSAWSVARLNEEIREVLADRAERFPTYVVGEVSEVNPYEFGTFFQLRDLEDDAIISCIAWSHAVDSFEYDLENGAKAVVRADVDFYPEKGNCQLVVKEYWPLGESARQQAYEELKGTLESEGLLADERKRQLPPFPDCIGVVTSLSGSAREDVTTAVHERAPGVDVKLRGATVQGEQAVGSLVGALGTLDNDPAVDVIVITRGGGADADLWVFNEEPLVRATADCSTPVVAAIGHEDDRTLTELVADERAMTPTDAGHKTAPDMHGLRDDLAALERRIDGAYRALVDDRIDEFGRRLAQAHDSLQQRIESARERRAAQRQRAADLEQRVSTAYATLVESRLDGLESRLDDAVRDIEHATRTDAVTAQAARSRVADLEARIDSAYGTHTERELARLESRIETAYREREADARVEAGTAEARRLRIVVAVLLALLVLGAAAVAILLL